MNSKPLISLSFFDLCIQICIFFISTICIWNNVLVIFCFFFSLHGNFQKLKSYPLLAQSPHKNMLGGKKRTRKHAYPFKIFKMIATGQLILLLLCSSAGCKRIVCQKLQHQMYIVLIPDVGLMWPMVHLILSHLAPVCTCFEEGGCQHPVTSSAPVGSRQVPTMNWSSFGSISLLLLCNNFTRSEEKWKDTWDFWGKQWYLF